INASVAPQVGKLLDTLAWKRDQSALLAQRASFQAQVAQLSFQDQQIFAQFIASNARPAPHRTQRNSPFLHPSGGDDDVGLGGYDQSSGSVDGYPVSNEPESNQAALDGITSSA